MSEQAIAPVVELPLEIIAQRIAHVRGQKILLDGDLAALYGVTTKRFNEQVKRNLNRFPADFMFQLTADEFTALRSQFATLKSERGQTHGGTRTKGRNDGTQEQFIRTQH